MNYDVGFAAVASNQILGLPAEAFKALMAALVQVRRDPYDSMPNRGDDPDDRQVVFGDYGLASFYIHQANRTVTVWDITWTG